MSNEGIVMSDRENKLPDAVIVAEMLKAKSIGVKMLASDCEEILGDALEHCKQGEPVAVVKDAGSFGKLIDLLPGASALNVGDKLFTHAMPKSEGKATLDKMREALEAVNGMFWVDKSTKHEIYESAHYPGHNQFTRESLGKHVFQLLRELDGETFDNNILSTPQPTTDISELLKCLIKISELCPIDSEVNQLDEHPLNTVRLTLAEVGDTARSAIDIIYKQHCTRSHPHENMDSACQMLTEHARNTHRQAHRESLT